ncbi:MAG: tRNA (adenosine(37)-N6)-threonylcarbamoyltransferase complex ATPase subunit type 1 TsaE [Desulfitobacteriaceae bacterium]
MEYTYISLDAAETRRFGGWLGRILRGGDIVCLIGELGAGKTAFAQGIGEALGVNPLLTSPTFTLVQEYTGLAQGMEVCLIHMDLYRLGHPEEAEVIGMADNFQTNTICLIEWPEIALDLIPQDRLEVVIEGSGEMPRNLFFRAESEDWARRWPGFYGGES